MRSVRRWYIYSVCAVSLQSVAWAAITLLRNLLISDWFSVTTVAMQIAILVIGVPVYLGHWLWAQRLARRDPDERASTVRSLYLHGAKAGLLAPAIPNAFYVLQVLLSALLGLQAGVGQGRYLASGDRIVHGVAAVVVLGLLWLYHWYVARAERAVEQDEARVRSIRRWYTWGFCAAGLAMVAVAAIGLVRWLLFRFGPGVFGGPSGLVRELARLIVGLTLWLPFWLQAQRRFAEAEHDERASVLRKVYLYAVVFVSVLTMVSTGTSVLASLFRRLLRVTGTGSESDIRVAAAVILPMAVVWAYHAWTLRRDAAVEDLEVQVRVRQTYRYLVAGVGLAAVLVAVAGLTSFVIRSLSRDAFVSREPVAWFLAALVAGVPVWLVPWLQVQKAAAGSASADDESGSLARRIYLYFFLFVATMTLLVSGVNLAAWLIGLALGTRAGGSFASAQGQPLAYSLIALGVWLYHGSILRGDGRRARAHEAERLAAYRVVVLDDGDGSLARRLIDALTHDLPGVRIQPAGLSARAAETLGTQLDAAGIRALVDSADILLGPWTMALPGTKEDQVASAIAASRADKLMVLTPAEGWQWVGVRAPKEQAMLRDAMRLVRQSLTRSDRQEGQDAN